MRAGSYAALLVLSLMTAPAVWPGNVLAGEAPPLLWAVADDTLSAPLGAVGDVAVGPDHTVYLLDTQTFSVRRFSANGSELSTLGRAGEGPGEIMHPRLVAAYGDGGCAVIQDFFAPVVCFAPNGRPRAGPDLSAIRDRFMVTQFLGAARTDALGLLAVSAITTDRGTPDISNAATSVFRLGPGGQVSVLFSDSERLCEPSTVRISDRLGHFAYRCWDISPAGRLIYADPDGSYRVFIGHPADGACRAIDLPEPDTDIEDLKRLASTTGQPWRDLPRIADVQWVNDKRFLVQAGACVSPPTASMVGTFELFDVDGSSHGRHAVHCDYDPSYDALFLRGGLIIVIRGGKSALEASLGAQTASPDGAASGDPDVIRVYAYDLASYCLKN